MKIKEVIIGNQYKLLGRRNSNGGCSKDYFKLLKGKPVQVLTKLSNFKNSNTVQVQGVCEINNETLLVEFWCSSFDLAELS